MRYNKYISTPKNFISREYIFYMDAHRNHEKWKQVSATKEWSVGLCPWYESWTQKKGEKWRTLEASATVRLENVLSQNSRRGKQYRFVTMLIIAVVLVVEFLLFVIFIAHQKSQTRVCFKSFIISSLLSSRGSQRRWEKCEKNNSRYIRTEKII